MFVGNNIIINTFLFKGLESEWVLVCNFMEDSKTNNIKATSTNIIFRYAANFHDKGSIANKEVISQIDV